MERKSIKYFSNKILTSELIRNATVLISGTVIAQLISILLQPFLRRYFSPEAFGIYSVYLSLVGIIAVITPLRYDDAVVLPKKDSDSANVLFLSFALNLFISFLLFLTILLFGRKLVLALNIPSNLPVTILYFIPLSVFLLNTYQIFNYWLIRQKKYYAVTSNKLIRRITEGTSQVVFAFLKYPKGLIYSDIIGQIANVCMTIINSIRSGFTIRLLSIKQLCLVMKEYLEFPKYNLIPAFMSACSYYLPTLFINKFFSTESTGYFDLTKLLLSIPLALIATSFSNVLLQRISEKYLKKESFINDLKQVLYVVGGIMIAEIIVISLFGPALFVFVFGKNWQISGDISKILVWSFAFNFIVSSFSSVYISMRKIKIYSIWQLFYFMIILSLVLFRHLSFVGFLKIYVMLEVFAYILISINMVLIIYRYENSIHNPRM